MNGHKLDISSSITQLGLSIASNLTWKPYINSIASQKLRFLSRARGYFSPSQLLTIYKSQICPSLKYCSHVWGGAPKSSLHLLDRVQSKAIRLINNPNLTNSLQSLSHRHLVADLSIFYRYFHGHCSQEIKNIILDPVRRVGTTISSTYSYPFQVTLPNPRTLSQNLLSFLELLNCGTHCHPLLSLNLTICHLLDLTSTNVTLSPFLLKLSLIFSVFPLSGLCYRPYGLSPTLLNKKKDSDLISSEWRGARNIVSSYEGTIPDVHQMYTEMVIFLPNDSHLGNPRIFERISSSCQNS